jgi:arylsulfatase A-like enzyme
MPAKKPNILILWGDDIGWLNINAYNHGVMGYEQAGWRGGEVEGWIEPQTLYREFFLLATRRSVS